MEGPSGGHPLGGRAPSAPGGLDSALLDEVQIVSGWMRQKTREGRDRQFPEAGPACGPGGAAGELAGTGADRPGATGSMKGESSETALGTLTAKEA